MTTLIGGCYGRFMWDLAGTYSPVGTGLFQSGSVSLNRSVPVRAGWNLSVPDLYCVWCGRSLIWSVQIQSLPFVLSNIFKTCLISVTDVGDDDDVTYVLPWETWLSINSFSWSYKVDLAPVPSAVLHASIQDVIKIFLAFSTQMLLHMSCWWVSMFVLV